MLLTEGSKVILALIVFRGTGIASHAFLRAMSDLLLGVI